MSLSLSKAIFHNDDDDAALALITEWIDQRWRPFFGALGIDPALLAEGRTVHLTRPTFVHVDRPMQR